MVEGKEMTAVRRWRLTRMLKWIHVWQTVTEIGTGTGCECECERGTRIGKGTKTGKGKGKGTGTGPEKGIGTGIGTGKEIVIVTEIVLRGGMVVGSVPLEVGMVEEADEERLVMLTMEIGRWRREWDCENLLFCIFRSWSFLRSSLQRL
jgi:hypothetical protein